MWTPCISMISNQGAIQQSVYATKPQEHAPRTDTPEKIYAIQGKRGTLFRFGQPSYDPNVILTRSGNLLHREYLESEFPLQEWTVPELLQFLLGQPDVLNHIEAVFVCGKKELLLGIHRGDMNLHYSGFFYFDENGLQIKDIETKANAKNSHELCAFTGIPQQQKKETYEVFSKYLRKLSTPSVSKKAVKAIVPGKGKR
jgi:hypothetical protein